MLRLLCVAAVCGSFVLASTRSSLAQAVPDKTSTARDPAGYKQAIESGIAEFEQGSFVEAREHFSRAHALFANARTLRSLGMVEFELHHYVDAASYLEQALASGTRRLDGRLRDETAALLARANDYVGSVRLHVEPASSTVSVDGFPVELDAHGALRLEIGDHVLEFRAPGRLPERRAIKLRGEQVLELRVLLAQPPAASAEAPRLGAREDTAPTVEPTPIYRRWWLWTLVGVVAAGGAATAVLLTQKTIHKEEPVRTSNTPTGANIQPLWSR